jgi:hypothetical protein
MFRFLGGTAKSFIAVTLVALFIATPLFCAAHSLHTAEAAEAVSEAPIAAAPVFEGESADHDSHGPTHHSHSEDELCGLGTALVPDRSALKLNVLSASLNCFRTSMTSCYAEVPQPVPI